MLNNKELRIKYRNGPDIFPEFLVATCNTIEDVESLIDKYKFNEKLRVVIYWPSLISNHIRRRTEALYPEEVCSEYNKIRIGYEKRQSGFWVCFHIYLFEGITNPDPLLAF